MIAALILAAGVASAQAPVIHRYAAGPAGLYVNAYLIEGRHGVVAIDATLTESDSRALRAMLDSLHKPLLAVLLTHGHPDHYNGITTLVTNLRRRAAVPVIATAGVDSVIRASDAATERQWRARGTLPNSIVRDGESVTFDGMRFTVHALGPGESHHDSYWVLHGWPRPVFVGEWRFEAGPQAVFVGDLVLNQMHAYTADGHTAAWLGNLDRVHGRLPADAVVYPGHGDPGSRKILEWQQRYLTTYRAAVAALSTGGTLDDSAKARLVVRMQEFLPSERLAFLIELGADAVAAEMAARRTDRSR